MSGSKSLTKGHIVTLVKREFWENRSLWIAPLAAAAVLVVLVAAGSLAAQTHMKVDLGGGPGVHIGPNDDGPSVQFGPGFGSQVLPPGVRPAAVGLMGLSTQLFFVAMLTAFFYLLDCLYTERKDRSILFWKSLPVSDANTVLSKFGVAMLIVPLGVWLLSVVVYPLVYGIAALGINNFAVFSGGWHTGDWLLAAVALVPPLLVSLLWYAPVAAWAMLASVVSRRSPVLIAALPWVVLAISEGIVLQSNHVWKFIGRRMVPITDAAGGITRPDLWIGLVAAAAILYLVIRLRRYRDDT